MGFPFKFGTAGIRARAGDGQGELNLRSVREIASAIADVLAAEVTEPGVHAVCVGFDGRRDSRAFAEQASRALLARGLRVEAFTEPCPTPLLAFCVRERGALAGLMVTASHNPPEDNGIKLYLAGGAQVAAPLDAAIEARIAAQPEPDAIDPADLDQARAAGRLGALGPEQERSYVQALIRLVPSTSAALPRLAYSALCGVGSPV
ncbi:MAG TPA: phospho-sugar mutase, partial [Polyangiaceae bacterium]|nr:phospho-sugar mutase [Polyangiaceae bacterium]